MSTVYKDEQKCQAKKGVFFYKIKKYHWSCIAISTRYVLLHCFI